MPLSKSFTPVIPQYKNSVFGPEFGYSRYLKDVLHANKKQLKHVKREEVDRVWAQMLPKWIPHDPRRCQRLLAEVKSCLFLCHTFVSLIA